MACPGSGRVQWWLIDRWSHAAGAWSVYSPGQAAVGPDPGLGCNDSMLCNVWCGVAGNTAPANRALLPRAAVVVLQEHGCMHAPPKKESPQKSASTPKKVQGCLTPK